MTGWIGTLSNGLATVVNRRLSSTSNQCWSTREGTNGGKNPLTHVEGTEMTLQLQVVVVCHIVPDARYLWRL